ncbi:MAG: hypothetical protein NDI93_00365 [Pseudomonas sp.]|nr:hypothetical protein [Pseudomonas sp.]
MKAMSIKAALAALLVGTAVNSVQAELGQWVWPEEKPQQLMIAESGSDRLMDYHQQRQSLANQRDRMDSGERFVQMIKEQPTAVGITTDEQSEKMSNPKSMYRPPIQRDRELYGK